ncbi:EAL domain-containing protein [Capilliphycus salinus ALCB114379]|uniref:EAL domain-containing protein n=1 Tax=Capilliphycus salinus TaxID=2768948 RepID=UPI0039A56CFA
MYDWFGLSKIDLPYLIINAFCDLMPVGLLSSFAVFEPLIYLSVCSILIILAYLIYQKKGAIFWGANQKIKREIKEGQQTEERYRQTVENSPNPIFSVDRQGKIKIWNLACQQIYCYSPTIIGQSWKTLVPEETLSKFEDLLTQVFQQKKSFSGIEMVYRSADKIQHFAISRFYPLLDDQQQVSECLVANTNITERKKNERERENLLAQEQAEKSEIKKILERINDGFFAVDRRWNITYLNTTGGVLIGKKQEELIGQNLWQMYPEALDSIFYHEYHKALNTNTTVHFEAFYPPLNCWYEVHAYPDENGLSVYFRDITEPKNSQTALKESQEFLQTIYDNAQYGIFIVDVLENGTFQYVKLNPIHEQLTGFSTEEIEGKTPQEILPPDIAQTLEQNYRRCIETKTVITYEEFVPFRGQDFWWLTSLAPLKNETGRIDRIVGTATNITALKQAQTRFQNLAANVPGAIFRYTLRSDGSNGVIYMNPGCYTLWEVEAEVVEQSAEILWNLIHPDDLPGMQESVLVSAQTLQPWFYEWRITTVSGTQKWVQGAGKPEQQSNGDIIWDTIIIDVTELRQAEKRWQNLAANIPGVIYRYVLHTDGSDAITYVSPGSRTLWEIEPDHIVQNVKVLWDLVHPEDLSGMKESLRVSAETLQPWFYEWRIVTPSGKIKWLQTAAKPEKQLNGDIIWDGLILDISDRQAALCQRILAEIALGETEERYRLLAENMSDLVCLHDREGRYLYVSPSCKSLLEYNCEELLGQNPYNFFHPEDCDRILQTSHLAALKCQPIPMTYRMRKKSGDYIWLETLTKPIVDRSGQVIRLQTTSRDITDRVQVEQKLRYDAKHDSLTGLPNRNQLIDRIELALERLKRYPDFNFAILFLDLDRFKIINDSLGHLAGDELLITVAHLLQGLIRSVDLAARFGGDEFVILLEEIDNINEAVRVAKRILTEFQSPFLLNKLNHQEVFITPSLGIVYGSRAYSQAIDLLRDADTAMYRAKAKGGERYEIFDPDMYLQALKRLYLENDLRQALDREEFVLYYQPIVSLESGKIAGMETLIRWQHPQKGLIPPSEFIPIAEETGLIVAMGMWVLKTACSQMKVWHQQFPQTRNLKLSVNLSVRQLREPTLIKQICEFLALTNFPAEYLTIELTESILLDDIENVIGLFNQLRSHSIQLSIDDFGTGYSSLSYLQRLPLNTIKIDRSFINCIGEPGQQSEIIEIIMTLAAKLKLEVVAEGIENQAQLEYLKQIGCPFAQGYLIAKPLTVEALTALFQQNWQYNTTSKP